MKKFSFSLGKIRKSSDSTSSEISKQTEEVKSDIVSTLKQEESKIKEEKKNVTIEPEVDEEEIDVINTDVIDDEDMSEKEYEYYWDFDYNKSFFNQILLDPVLRYAMENWNWKFLRSMKYGDSKNDEVIKEYEIIKQEMIDNWWENMSFEGSLLQKISENYVYFRALEKIDGKFLDKLRNGSLLFNDYSSFARNNGIDIVVWSLWFRKYHEFITSKNLH